MTDVALGGGDFYDEPHVFAVYHAHRTSGTSPNELIEGPAVLELLGPVHGRRILELGCGDGQFGRFLLQAGCAAYTGIDASARMVALAQQALDGTAGAVQRTRIEQFAAPPASVDLVVSRLALHYVDDLRPVFERARQALRPGGRLVFSVEHPVITSCDRGWDQRGPRADWLVDDYFVSGRRETAWLGGRVVKFHRTVEQYVRLVQDAGFTLERLCEPGPERARFASEAEFRRRQRIPLFLLLAAGLPAT